MDLWWGEAWHRGHEEKIRDQLKIQYGDQFICSNRNLIWMLRRQGLSEPCQAHFSFKWSSRWGEAPRITVTVSCACAEIFEIFYVDLSSHGEILSDTIAPWKLPIAA